MALERPLDRLGIIAGNRSLPLTLAREARAAGVAFLFAVAFEGETDPELASLVDEIEWIRVGQLSRMIRAFRRREIRHCVMVGQIAPKNLFDLRPDLRAMRLLLRLRERNAHSLFGAIADELDANGIRLIEATPWLRPLMPGAGFLLGPPLKPEQRADAALAFRMAKETSRLDIGQTVVVKEGTVLAVEGFEGTDACLKRGGELAGPKGGAVAAKVAKERHDVRFDIPCIGPQTIQTCLTSGISVLSIEASKTLVLEQAEIEGLIQNKRFTLLTATTTQP